MLDRKQSTCRIDKSRLLLVMISIGLSLLLFSFAYYHLLAGLPLNSTKKIAYFACIIVVPLSFGLICCCGRKVRMFVLCLLFNLFAIEFILQGLAVLKMLPNLKCVTHVSFGRVYCAKESRNNSIRNRYGWHGYTPRLDCNSMNIVFIGDSFVEAFQVPRNESMAYNLEELMQQRNTYNVPVQVISIGESGFGPAHYFELLKYACRHFYPDEVVLFLYLGNDITNSSPKLQVPLPKNYIYYQCQTDGTLILHPESVAIQKRLIHKLETNHVNPCLISGEILRSHLLLPKVVGSIIKGIKNRLPIRNKSISKIGDRNDIENKLEQLGLDASVFSREPSDEVSETLALVKKLIVMCNEYLEERDIRLRLVTIPFFPEQFYEINKSETKWSTKISDYDFLFPEAILSDWADELGIPILLMGKYMRIKGIDSEDIRKLYLANGEGHLSSLGHSFFADAIHSVFYSNQKNP